VVVLVVEPLPGESAARGFGPGLLLTPILSDNGDALFDPSELDLECELDAPDNAFLAATCANSCINIRFCSVPAAGNGIPEAAAAAAAAKSVPIVTSALPYI
jgi:hypothetical protein